MTIADMAVIMLAALTVAILFLTYQISKLIDLIEGFGVDAVIYEVRKNDDDEHEG